MIRTRVGYAGGERPNPTYDDLFDHTEAIAIDFDPQVVTYDELLAIFVDAHDATRAPFSRQYRSAIWVHDDAQRAAAERVLAAETERRGRAVRTQIEAVGTFWPAEDYHQKYVLQQVPALVRAVMGSDVTQESLMASTAAARANGWAAGHGDADKVPEIARALGIDEAVVPALQKALRARAPVQCGG